MGLHEGPRPLAGVEIARPARRRRPRPTLIGTRHGHGYALELAPEAVRIINGSRVSEEGNDSESATESGTISAHEGEDTDRVRLGSQRFDSQAVAAAQLRARRGPALVAASLVAILVLRSGWFAVSRFSQRDVAGSAAPSSFTP
jgi:hypothetical protein